MNQFSQPGEDMRDANVALARVKRAEMVKAFVISGEYRGRFGGDSSNGAQFGPIALLRPESWPESIQTAIRLSLPEVFTRLLG
jgi:hypothetical protein